MKGQTTFCHLKFGHFGCAKQCQHGLYCFSSEEIEVKNHLQSQSWSSRVIGLSDVLLERHCVQQLVVDAASELSSWWLDRHSLQSLCLGEGGAASC